VYILVIKCVSETVILFVQSHCRRDNFHCDVALNRLDKSLTERNSRAREDIQSSAYKLHRATKKS